METVGEPNVNFFSSSQLFFPSQSWMQKWFVLYFNKYIHRFVLTLFVRTHLTPSSPTTPTLMVMLGCGNCDRYVVWVQDASAGCAGYTDVTASSGMPTVAVAATVVGSGSGCGWGAFQGWRVLANTRHQSG